MTIKGASRPIVLAFVALAAGLCIAACGSSSTSSTSASSGSSGAKSTTTASTGPSAERTKLAACLKAHGVTLPARPAGGGPPVAGTSTTPPTGSGGGGGGFFGGGGGFAARNPKFAAAFKACAADFGGRFGGRFGAGRGRFSPHFSTAVLASFAACVKKHGYTLPKPNTTGKGPIFPASIEANKTFQAASKSCASVLRAGFRRPGAGGTSTTGTTASS